MASADPQANFKHELLIISPHPDDAELFCGGLILKMAGLGYRVAVVDLSEAELSTYGSSELRRAETEAASRFFKLAFRTNLGLANCWFHEHSGFDSEAKEADSAAAKLTSVIRMVRPEVVIAPYWEDRHPDHVQASRLATRSLFLSGLRRFEVDGLAAIAPRQLLFYGFRYEMRPSFIVDISEVAERKYQGMCCYESQLKAPEGEDAVTLLASSLSLRSLRARDMYFGSYIGTDYGEGYLSQTMLRIDDPVKSAREHYSDKALFFPKHF